MIGYYNYTVILTYLSLISAVTGITFSFCGHPGFGIFCLLFCGLCDAFDGKIARTRKQSTRDEKRFGIQIDSLCDLVSFAVLPCCIAAAYLNIFRRPPQVVGVISLIFALFVLGAVIRLAYYNVEEENRQEQTDACREHYRGLPVTTVSLIMPAVYSVNFIDRMACRCLMVSMFLLVGAAFVSGFRLKKAGLRGLLIMVGIGVIELIVIILLKTRFFHAL